jgi:hypothetical protein
VNEALFLEDSKNNQDAAAIIYIHSRDHQPMQKKKRPQGGAEKHFHTGAGRPKATTKKVNVRKNKILAAKTNYGIVYVPTHFLFLEGG